MHRAQALVLGTAAVLVIAGSAAAATILGTAKGEVIKGTATADRLYGGGGDDRLFGRGGGDLLVGGPGRDLLDGGPGDDTLRARDGEQDVVRCGSGVDRAIVDHVDTTVGCETRSEPTPAPLPSARTPAPTVVENARAGSPGWNRESRSYGRAIEGYVLPDAAPGDTVTFHVSTDPPAPYRILIHRIGWYGGAGSRLVACLPSCDGQASGQTEPIPRPTPEGLVDAGWPASQTLVVPTDWTSGYYAVHFVLTGGPHAGEMHPGWLVVREVTTASRAPILVIAPSLTWQAYNGWGGGSVYGFNSPHGQHAAKVSFDRPYDRTVRGDNSWELPLVRFLEHQGLDVAYETDVAAARQPESLAGRELVIVAGHSEYWPKQLRDSIEQARDAGTNLAFMGANAAYWQVRLEDDFQTMVSYKNALNDPEPDPALKTVLYRELDRPECVLIGVQHQGGKLDWPNDGDYVVDPGASSNPWIRQAGLNSGDVIRGIVSREVDTLPSWRPRAEGCGNNPTVLFHRELGGDTSGNADSTVYVAKSGARVFAAGSHQFVWGLEDVSEIEMGHGRVDERLRRFVAAMLDELAPAGR